MPVELQQKFPRIASFRWQKTSIERVMDLLPSLLHPVELVSLIKFRLFGCAAIHSRCDTRKMDEEKVECYSMLKQTSRSFSAVIMALESDLGYAVCIFYLVLRALDTVEDDMSIPLQEKLALLRSFHTRLQMSGWNYPGSQEKDRVVLVNFHVISAQFRQLEQTYQDVISDTCRRMGEGMASFLERDFVVETYGEWDEYCHYVAGLVGIGLSRLFCASQLERASVGEREALSNAMGLFLQKTNIVRDVLEDVRDGRRLWPKEVVGRLAPGLGLEDLLRPEQRAAALRCLNELVANALTHVPDVMTYLRGIQTPSVFSFCAIPQVMAIATLERCYNNPDVFEQRVKIRRGESAMIMNYCGDMRAVEDSFRFYTAKIVSRMEKCEPREKSEAVKSSLAACGAWTPVSAVSSALTDGLLLGLVGVALWKYYSLSRPLLLSRLS